MIRDDAPRLEVKPLVGGRWGDLEALFGDNGACAGCWCMWWRQTRRQYERCKGERNRRAFRAIVRAGPPPGLIAYVGGEPAGWCQVGPRAELPGLGRSRLTPTVDDMPVWAISCLFVHRRHRRTGLTTVLIEAARDHAVAAGAPAVEAYPWDVAEKKAASTVFTGLASTYRRLGFVEVARPAPHRPVMRHTARRRA